MNCQGFENIVNDLARQNLVDAKLLFKQALAHCNDCKACALRFENERVLTFGLAALAAEMKSLEVPERVEAELMAVWRQRRTLAQRSASQGSWRRLVASAAVAAAVVLIAFGANVLRLLQIESPEQMTIAPLEMAPASPKVLPQMPDPSVEYSASLQPSGPRKTVKFRIAKHRPKPNDSSVAKANTSTATIAQAVEVTTEFMPMGYVNAASLQDGGQVVRVELPRHAMARFGLPVNMDRYDERVKADVWVGADGLARAIRFVQ